MQRYIDLLKGNLRPLHRYAVGPRFFTNRDCMSTLTAICLPTANCPTLLNAAPLRLGLRSQYV
jgi:hypothetical protein